MKSSKRILAVMSEWGYWGIELVGPMNKLTVHRCPTTSPCLPCGETEFH